MRIPLLVILVAVLGCSPDTTSSPQSESGDRKLTIALLPKLKNIAFFDACHRGARQAAQEFDVDLVYDGPDSASGSEQIKFIETWIRQGVDAICIAPNQPKGIKRLVDKAHARGIHVLTWDTDAPQSGRDLMVNQIDDRTLAHALIDDLAEQMNRQGEWAVVIATPDAANLNTWRRIVEARAKEQYPELTLVNTIYTDENENLARQRVETLLNKHPKLKGLIAFDSGSLPGAADALERTGKQGTVALVGNATPGKMKGFLQRDVLKSFYLWDPIQQGALTIQLAAMFARGEEVSPGIELPGHGPLRFSETDPKMVIMGEPIRFTKENIDQYDWGF